VRLIAGSIQCAHDNFSSLEEKKTFPHLLGAHFHEKLSYAVGRFGCAGVNFNST